MGGKTRNIATRFGAMLQSNLHAFLPVLLYLYTVHSPLFFREIV